MAWLYLFVSTTSAASINDDSLRSIQRIFGPNTFALNVGDGGQYWSNGFALRFHSSDPLQKWKPWLTDELKEVTEFWLLHDGAGNAIDNMSDGPGTMALQKMGSKSICQLFLRYDQSAKYQAERVAKLMKEFEERKVNCRYAFGFNNGGIHFLTSLQVGQTIFRRCESAFRGQIEFTLVDARGVCYGTEGEVDDAEAWTVLRPVSKPFQLFANQ